MLILFYSIFYSIHSTLADVYQRPPASFILSTAQK